MASSNLSSAPDAARIPAFSALPLREGDPFLSAWGLYGDQDELGTLNRLTDEIVAEAAKSEIRTGHRVSLNWPFDAQKDSSYFQRAVFHLDLLPAPNAVGNDDVWTFNPQVTSQWDGLRHYGYQKEELFYNGITMADIHQSGSKGNKGNEGPVNGIQAWAERGIVGRGVLIDYHGWRTTLKESVFCSTDDYDAFETKPISLDDLKACLAAQQTEVKFGDVLLIRSGFMAGLATKSEDDVRAHQAQIPHRFGGVGQYMDMLRWIWEHFSAVAGDQPSFECWPPTRDDWSLHEVLLAGWGCPIGELFDLEALAEHCKSQSRWSFFLTSEPCNVPGAVSSPPNALAIF